MDLANRTATINVDGSAPIGLAIVPNIYDGGIVKTGSGHTRPRRADNRFNGGLNLQGGSLMISTAALGGGTLRHRLRDNASWPASAVNVYAPMSFGGSFTMDGFTSVSLLGPATMNNPTTITTTDPLSAVVYTLGGPISGSGSLTKSGPGLLVLAMRPTPMRARPRSTQGELKLGAAHRPAEPAIR